MGVVYRAQQHRVDREVAIKFLHPLAAGDASAVKRFMDEARKASRLNHPNVVTVHDFGQTPEGELSLVMELLAGTPLDARLAAKGTLRPNDVVWMAVQLCRALDSAHRAGLVHRDLKPANVFEVETDESLFKILDFGVAQRVAGSGGTTSGNSYGTPAYMSPEQIMGDRGIDGRSDIYSLAVLLYELLVGHCPFEGETPHQLWAQHSSQSAPGPGSWAPHLDIPAELERVILSALEKDPQRRPQSALEFSRQLCDAVDRPQWHRVRMTVPVDGSDAANAANLRSMPTQTDTTGPVPVPAVTSPESSVGVLPSDPAGPVGAGFRWLL